MFCIPLKHLVFESKASLTFRCTIGNKISCFVLQVRSFGGEKRQMSMFSSQVRYWGFFGSTIP